MSSDRLKLLIPLSAGVIVLASLLLSGRGSHPPGRGVFIAHPESEHATGILTVRFDEAVPRDRWEAILIAHGAALQSEMLVDGFAVASVPDDQRNAIGEALAASGAVRSVEEVTYRKPVALPPNDDIWPDQWNMRLISADSAWDVTQGQGVKVAVIDTGVAYEEFGQFKPAPDLGGTAFADPWDFYGSGPSDPVGDEHANDDNGHGTHVAGTIAQTTNNAYGAAGIAYKATIIPVRVCGPKPPAYDPRNPQCPTTAIANGIYWATNHGARVINISLSAPGGITDAEKGALEYARGAGAVVVVAAGNSGGPVLEYPAAIESVVSVAAVAYNGTLASYSNYGAGADDTLLNEFFNLDLIAPGGNPPPPPTQALPTDVITQESLLFLCDGTAPIDYQVFAFCGYAGTSMAAAHVSGVAALIRSAFPNLNRTQVAELLHCSAADAGAPGWDTQNGFGLVQADAAVRDSDGDQLPDCIDPTPTTPTPSPTPSPTPVPPPNDCLPPSPTATPPPTPTPTLTATPRPSDTPPDSPTDTPSVTPDGPTPTATATETPLPTDTPSQSPEDTLESVTPTETPTETPEPTPMPIPCGDVDCNLVVDARDAMGVIRFMALVTPVAACLGKGYVNCDADLNQLDALVILRYAGGITLGIPSSCSGIG